MPFADTPLPRAALLALAVVVAAGCGSSSPTHTCTLVGTMPGVGVRVTGTAATGAAEVQARACQQGSCQDVTVRLMPSRGTSSSGCDGDMCSAVTTPLPERNGFIDLTGLTTAPVRLSLTVRDAAGGTITAGEITVTPGGTYPNGPNCGVGSPQAQVLVADGGITAA
ncbi:hypothetical protein [Yinghuangia sp. YIM S10712]|uniref:hypothetical protein n=1 Tax=Yinghuangia sp. YIM S10712 TaxID=3436930 RepID=UPI003F52B5EA